MNNYVPLNVRSSYSMGDSIAQIPRLVRKARELALPAMALVDTNMHGAKEFHDACLSMSERDYGRLPTIKPIIGLAVRIRERGVDAPLVLLAKNKDGYHNLVRITSENAVQGQIGELVVPKDVLFKAKRGLICLAGSDDIELAKECAKSFCGDFAFMALHDDEEFPDWKTVNVCAMPPVRFLDKDDAEAYDAYRAFFESKRMDATDARRCDGTEYLMSGEETASLFARHPAWVENARQLAEEIEEYNLSEAPEVAEFPIPQEFPSSMAYLRDLVAKGAAGRWGEPLPREVSDRLEFELSTIEHFCGKDRAIDVASYFLIVQDYVAAARRMGVWVGPGRGSAPGSAVAYALGITAVDPIKHGLLFERFLNPDRISMPDIDIDFDDAGRRKVMRYIVEKYGRDHVAHICTIGKFAPKGAIMCVAKAMRFNVGQLRQLTDQVPLLPKPTFASALRKSKALRTIYDRDPSVDCESKVLHLAEKIDGCASHSGVHACGIVVSKRKLVDSLPIMAGERAGQPPITQYDGRSVETVGLLKFDLLGLTTLSRQKECIRLIKERTEKSVDLERIPENDPEALDVFAQGDTVGIFQFESDGMKKWLKELKASCLADLAAMNALYRPGPLEYVPTFVRRKIGEEPVVYDHPLMEETLHETYGVTVYQEQVMLLSRKLAGFTRADSDKMRKAMGLKRLDIMEGLKSKFVEGCLANPSFRIGKWAGETEARCLIDKVWDDWRSFASYAFNKSHAVCYAWLAYQSAYLKAHHPAEFAAAFGVENP